MNLYWLRGCQLMLMLIGCCPISSGQADAKFHVGIEQDLVPYATGGYFASVWLGSGHWKTRLLHVKATKPDFLLADGFTDNVIKAYAIVLDYHLSSFSKGLWLGGGLVRWDATIRSARDGISADYRLHLVHGSLGYHFPLRYHFYISPWAGMHFKVTGPRDVAFSAGNYRIPFLNPEASIKLGWFF